MHRAADVVARLRANGELWEAAPGLVALRGDTLRLYRSLEQMVRLVASRERADDWQVPPALPFETLRRADYFASFPQWLTAAAHLDAGDVALEQIAAAPDPARAAVAALQPCAIALQPAVCYHVYAALAGTTAIRPRCCTLSGTCWRHEAGRFAPLERGWAFSMREIVCIGSAGDIAEFRARGIEAACALARALGLRAHIAEASDPFFAPSTRGRALLQRLRALKHELLLPLGDGRTMAAASFNDHAQFFGDAFDIRDGSGAPAASGCVAYGLERWLLAVLVEHGPDARNWPMHTVPTDDEANDTWLSPSNP
jgi:seryl-tRNA synthetase